MEADVREKFTLWHLLFFFKENLMARKSRYMGYQNGVKTMRNAPEVPKWGSGHESICQRLMRLKAKEKTMEKQGAGSHE